METKFTKGEWITIFNINKTGKSGVAVMDFQPHVICEMGDAEETEANQKLIAAAPDLLDVLSEAVEVQEALINLINADADWYNNNVPHVGKTVLYKERATTPDWLIKAKAAIKKATI